MRQSIIPSHPPGCGAISATFQANAQHQLNCNSYAYQLVLRFAERIERVESVLWTCCSAIHIMHLPLCRQFGYTFRAAVYYQCLTGGSKTRKAELAGRCHDGTWIL
eukprot:scaffold179642_cov24-Prasinocladus_malaysianus.AAC.1